MDSGGPAQPDLKVLATDTDAMTANLLAADLRRQQCFDVGHLEADGGEAEGAGGIFLELDAF